MIPIILSLTSYLLSAICNAIIETVRNHPQSSIFPKTNWWNISMDSWKNKYKGRDITKGRTNIPVQFTDAIHFFKVLEVLFAMVPLLIFALMGSVKVVMIYALIGWIVAAILRNLFFSIFYNHILIKKK